MIKILLLIFLAVGGLIGYAYYTDQNLVTNSVTDILNYKPDIECNIAGDCVEFKIPFVGDSSDTIHATDPVDYNIDNVTDTRFDSNGTVIPKSSYITGNINDVYYSKQGSQQSRYTVVGDTMKVQIGNIASIDGQIKIVDPLSGEIIEPRTAKYTLTIQCSDLTEFCNLETVAKRGTTTTSGTFHESWTTTSNNSIGLYEVQIFAISETKDMFGRYYEVKNTLFLELYQ